MLNRAQISPSPDLDEVADAIDAAFPKLTADEQRLSLALYRLLAKGRPVAIEALARGCGTAAERIQETLGRWPGVYRNHDGAVIGYWGLSVVKMNHRFRVGETDLYTWCAWDNLFIPPLIGAAAEVESACPVSGERIALTVTPHGIESVRPASVALSFIAPERARIEENVVANFCHYVHFFAAAEQGERWVAEHPGTFVLSLADAWELGRRRNAARYAAVGLRG